MKNYKFQSQPNGDKNRSRVLILFVGIVVLWGVLILRASVLQVFPNKRLEALQSKQFQTVITLQNRRGAIVDSTGRELAVSTKAYSVYADPKLIEAKKSNSKKIAAILGQSFETVYAKIKDGNKRFVWLQRLMDEDHANRLRSLEIKGLQIVEEFRRIYPNENLLSQVIGFIGQEGQGLEGLEKSFDKELQGNKKKVTVRRDARGRPLVADGLMFAENPEGAEIKLTVDADLQHTLETELNSAIANFDADNAMGIILDAKTSAILAMSAAPSFDANNAAKLKPEQRRNRVVTDVYEAGSTMKAFVIAGALREKIVQPNTRYNTENGKFQVGDRVIREAETHERWPSLTVSEILAYSSNIGTTKIAFDLGPEALQKTLTDFGFGQKTGVDLPGDGKGLMKPLPWRQHLLANISFGHGVAVTALQIANAYASIANGGQLNTPFIVQSVRDPDTGLTTEYQPKPIRRVLSEQDAASLRLMLTGATAAGATGINAKVDGFIVAGKTGTAQKVDSVHGGYLANAYVSSFAGFMPANDPKYVIYVMVDHPKKNAYYGSQVAAPIFSRLASYAARRAGLAPMLLTEKNFADKDLVANAGKKQPTVKELEKKLARGAKLSKAQLKRLQNMKNPVLPKTEGLLTSADVAFARTPQSTDLPIQNQTQDQVQLVPDLSNLTLREVLKRVSSQDLQVKFRGQGVVSEVIPSIGSPVPEDKQITVILKSGEEIR